MSTPAPPDRLFLRGARLCDGSAPPAHGSLLLEAGAVAAVVDPGAPPPEGARVVDLPGALVVPGLADVHTHLVLGGDVTAYDRELLKESLPYRALRAAANARHALDHGVLTMRDVCTEGAGYADVALRDAIRAGLAEGPRVVPSGPGLGITGGYMPWGFAPGVCVPTGCAIVDAPDAARREVRVQVSYGVEWIKVFADWPGAGAGDPRVRVTFTEAELSAVCDEARRRGVRVAAHVTSDAGARQAVACGVASLEHMGDLSRETLDAAAAAGVTLVPTLSVMVHLDETAPPEKKEALARRREKTVQAFERAIASGVRIACGTDIGCFPHERGSLGEIGLMMDLGMRPLAALRAATSEAAALLELPSIGRLSPGAAADLAVFAMPEENDDLRAVFGQKPVMVVQGGRVVRDRTGA